MEQPERQLECGHGYGHPGLKETWREVWPDKKPVQIATSGHYAGWHIPLREGGRGLVLLDSTSHPNFGAMGDVMAQVEAHHGGPVRVLGGREHLDPDVALVQHPEGNLISPPFPFDWEHYKMTGEMRRKGEAPVQPETEGGFDFSAPAPAPRR